MTIHGNVNSAIDSTGSGDGSMRLKTKKTHEYS